MTPFARGFLCLAGAASLWLPPLVASAGEPVVNWPVPTPPAGSNPAVFAVPKNDWMVHFQRSLDRTKQGNIDLIFDGDSITDFYLGTGKKVWEANYSKLKAVDYAISGDKTENLLWRLNEGEVAGLHAKMVVLLIGTNDMDLSELQIADGITAVVHAYQQACPSAVILLQGVLPAVAKRRRSVAGQDQTHQRHHRQAGRVSAHRLHRFRRQVSVARRDAVARPHARFSAPKREGI